MPMANMQMSQEEAKEYGGMPDPGKAPKYPYGLCLCLNDDALEKLGINTPLAVGTEVMVMAKAKVTSTGAREDMDGESEASMELQITDLEISPLQSTNPKAMFPSMT